MPFEKVELPSGAWAALRDPEQTTEAQRRPAARAQLRIGLDKLLVQVLDKDSPASQVDLTDSQLDLLNDYMDLTMLALVEEWSFEQPITIEGLHAIPGSKDYSALALACKKHQDALFPNFGVDPEKESPGDASDG